MGTRSQIGFYREPGEQNLDNWDALIYRHWDGYPDGVLPDILRCCGIFGSIGFGRHRVRLGLVSQTLEARLFERWISKGFHGDTEYFYAVYPDRVDVYETALEFDEEKSMNERAHKINSITL